MSVRVERPLAGSPSLTLSDRDDEFPLTRSEHPKPGHPHDGVDDRRERTARLMKAVAGQPENTT
jgi:hypothetical protein